MEREALAVKLLATLPLIVVAVLRMPCKGMVGCLRMPGKGVVVFPRLVNEDTVFFLMPGYLEGER